MHTTWPASYVTWRILYTLGNSMQTLLQNVNDIPWFLVHSMMRMFKLKVKQNLLNIKLVLQPRRMNAQILSNHHSHHAKLWRCAGITDVTVFAWNCPRYIFNNMHVYTHRPTHYPNPCSLAYAGMHTSRDTVAQHVCVRSLHAHFGARAHLHLKPSFTTQSPGHTCLHAKQATLKVTNTCISLLHHGRHVFTSSPRTVSSFHAWSSITAVCDKAVPSCTSAA